MRWGALKLARRIAAALGLVVLAWQVGNAGAGRFSHPFLIADLIGSAWLIAGAVWADRRGARVLLLSGFGAMFGVFLSAVTGRMLAGEVDVGAIAAGLGLAPCLLGIILSGRGD